jgi:hypothetical protein
LESLEEGFARLRGSVLGVDVEKKGRKSFFSSEKPTRLEARMEELGKYSVADSGDSSGVLMELLPPETRAVGKSTSIMGLLSSCSLGGVGGRAGRAAKPWTTAIRGHSWKTVSRMSLV